ncbi:protein of unknown function (DUF2993) [Rubidibacter lacunae KORDI 51-2]|uniref:DUF2993 domain-containing protein n=1 Tax=Rubidibacter lacunae KORDI 51-2 TaxID=582515 RepID=U5DJD1_9CHRO|nr:DUF2993 domain-containing protein [Rubidibacter lacunae]ERN39795.1 protein of unknown function (DUF2993) [Rubidibacter lacunae KORDI 51-2]
MLGGFTGFQDSQGKDWGENLLNSVASKTIRHLFTHSDLVDVEVRCSPPGKLLQGSIDSFKMSGRGLVIRKAFRAEELNFETDAVVLDFGSVLKGGIALKQPTQAIAQVKLAEPDINTAFEAPLIRQRLENLTDPQLLSLSDGAPVSFGNVKMELLPNNGVNLQAAARWSERAVPLALSCTLGVERRRRIRFNSLQFRDEAIPEDRRDLSGKLTGVMGDILNNMVDLDRFNLDGVTMRINRLETQGRFLVFSGYAQIEHVPRIG